MQQGMCTGACSPTCRRLHLNMLTSGPSRMSCSRGICTGAWLTEVGNLCTQRLARPFHGDCCARAELPVPDVRDGGETWGGGPTKLDYPCS